MFIYASSVWVVLSKTIPIYDVHVISIKYNFSTNSNTKLCVVFEKSKLKAMFLQVKIESLTTVH